MENSLEQLAKALANHPAVREKLTIEDAYAPAEKVSQNILLGDDAAAIPDPESGGHLLFAAEGMIDSFVQEDPWFAGYSAIMVNLSDIAAMGGHPIAITDILWTPSHDATEEIWKGMQAASTAYNVPIVGGHTTHSTDKGLHLAAAVLGKAGPKLLTSFDAEVGDDLIFAVDLRGTYRRNKPFWNSSTTTSPEELQQQLSLLSRIANEGLSKAAKDVSNGGLVGTVGMLCQCSKVGVEINLPSIPKPPETDTLKWLTSFPSFGYILSCASANSESVIQVFSEEGISATPIGKCISEHKIRIKDSDTGQRALVWDFEA